ncbi:unnamed protein product [Allacma fusca]|uniref:Uncharacterized protein n=1 Tax=Allacma fusca TaxID=39272 RepID=A0A8J2LHL4_9HEXA|nr:unnamed protein product [Allacma fusca]
MERSEKIVVLTARDWDDKIIIDEKTANVSGTIRGMMEASVEESNGSNLYPILIDCPHADVLEKVMEWAKHHKYDHPNEVPRSDDEYSVWDLMYFNVSDNTLLKILVVSNYLEMADLFRQTITMLRHRLRSQTEDQLRRRAGAYGEQGDLFDDEEQAQVKRENAMVKLSKEILMLIRRALRSGTPVIPFGFDFMVSYTQLRMHHGKKRAEDVSVAFSRAEIDATDSPTGSWRPVLHGVQDPHHECTITCTSPLINAARNASPEEMEMALETGANVNGRDCMGRTALHWAVTVGCNCDSCIANSYKCMSLLVDYPRCDINAQDNQGFTPLHLAAESQSTRCASKLLYNGADVSIKSKDGTKALILIIEKIPDAMECLLDTAVTVDKYDINNVKCEIRLDFGAIVGYSETRGWSRYTNKNKSTKERLGKPRKEMLLLTLILDASSGSRKKILTHPLIAIFLYLKWRRVRIVFWATILCNVLLLLLYSLYVLDVYLVSCPYRPKLTEPAAVKAAKTLGVLTADNHTMDFIKFSWFQFTPTIAEVTETMKGDGCHLEIGPTVKSVLLLGLSSFMVINEVFKILPAPRAYMKRTMNKIQWTLFFFIFLTSWPAFMSAPNISFWQYQAAAFGLFLAWALMLSQIGKFPKLGLYVDILGHVLKNFGFFMFTYASLVIAFALSFCVLFPGNAPYSSIPLAVLKVLMMMVGEVNYEDLFYGNEESPVDDLLYPLTGHILYGAFVIMITIVLMNLLVGLTVSDIQGLKKDAELTRISRQISEISQLESLIFSRRVQSFFPGRLGSFIRESILVVPPGKINDEDPDLSPYMDSCNVRIRPNDQNDETIPEELKVPLLKLVAGKHRSTKMNRCPKNPSNIEPNKQQRDPMIFRKNHYHFDERNLELIQKLEDKIMERMTIQMDRLYQKLEKKIVEN